ncbi:MAG: acyl-CoA carboxylase subunit beta [Clostridia bacterium]|nr:acyl-CoA carboxylase subunit beta [Clostridia bacterium]
MDQSLVEKQHKKGKLYVEERLALLFDDQQYTELTTPEDRDGVYICEGRVFGKRVVVAAQDFTFKGGTLGLRHGKNIAMGLDRAMRKKCPFVSINDSGGARIQEGIDALAGYGDIFFRNTKASGRIPQISMILGPCAGGAVYSPGITDFIFMTEKISQMFITGPKVIHAVTGESITGEALGGTVMHGANSGVAHICTDTELECFMEVRRLIGMIPSNCRERRLHCYVDMGAPEFSFQMPEDNHRGYDISEIISSIFDTRSFMELQPDFARSIVIGLAKLGGETVGIIANQPRYMAGVLDCNSSDKAARFVRFCDAFRIPIVTFTDVPGYLPGIAQEQAGIIRHGAKLLYAFSEATVPKVNVILHKAYGGAYIAMNSLHIGADCVFSWPGAEVAVMGEQGAVEILYARDVRNMDSQQARAFLDQKAEEYRREVMNTRLGLKRGYITAEIRPEQTRDKLIEQLNRLSTKAAIRRIVARRRHGNIPL